MEFSTRAVGKLLQAFDRIIQRNERLGAAIQAAATSSGGSVGEDGEGGEEGKKEGEEDAEKTGKEGDEKGEDGEEKGGEGAAATTLKLNINEEVKKLNFDMQMETSRLQVGVSASECVISFLLP